MQGLSSRLASHRLSALGKVPSCVDGGTGRDDQGRAGGEIAHGQPSGEYSATSPYFLVQCLALFVTVLCISPRCRTNNSTYPPDWSPVLDSCTRSPTTVSSLHSAYLLSPCCVSLLRPSLLLDSYYTFTFPFSLANIGSRALFFFHRQPVHLSRNQISRLPLPEIHAELDSVGLIPLDSTPVTSKQLQKQDPNTTSPKRRPRAATTNTEREEKNRRKVEVVKTWKVARSEDVILHSSKENVTQHSPDLTRPRRPESFRRSATILSTKMGLIDRIQAKIELFRLEQRYTRRRHRRSTFVSNAIYVDGEYVYQTPNATGSSTASHDSSSNSSNDATPTYEAPSPFSQSPAPAQVAPAATMSAKERKKMNRFSSMPGFGSSTNRDVVAPAPDWRARRASFDGSR